jgi:hypothetical protein
MAEREEENRALYERDRHAWSKATELLLFYRKMEEIDLRAVATELDRSAESNDVKPLRDAIEMTASLPKRRGDTRSVQNPRTIRSHRVRFGLRRRERFMISNWCLTASDSAATARTPPGRTSRARVTSKWANRMNNELTGKEL